MGYCIIWVILTMMSFQMVLSYNVTLSPESITTEVGTDSVNFTCTIQLEIFEAISEHWIIWWKDNTKIADNDEVLINSAKYSVHGVSSAAKLNYTQTLQVKGIEETDHGIYTCTLFFSSYSSTNNELSISSDSTLIMRNFIPQPLCSKFSSESETGQQQMTLVCTCSPSDPVIILYWNDNEDNTLALTLQQNKNERLTLVYTVTMGSESSNQWFTCTASNTGATDTKECVISNQTLTTMMPTTSITVSQKLPVSVTVDERSTTVPTKTTKAISHSPITFNITSYAAKPTATEQNDITTSINVEAETSLPHKNSTSVNVTISSSNNNINTIIIFAVLVGVILMTVFIAMLLLLRTHLKSKSKNKDIHLKKCARGKYVDTEQSSSECEEPEGGIDIHNENQDHQLIPIKFGDGQLDGQCAVYKNSAYETNTDDPDPFYAAVGQKNVEESRVNVATDISKKTEGIYPLEDNSEYMSIEETALKKATGPPIIAEKPKKFMVKSYSAPNGDMYAQVDKSSISSSDRISTQINEEDRVKNYPAPNGDMYAQVDKSSNSISDRLSTLLINEEEMSVRRKKSEEKDVKLRDEKKNIGVSKKSSTFVDNDDTYTTIQETVQNSDGEEETDEFTEAEVKETDEEDDKHEEDNVSRMSVGSSGSIHYEVDSNAVYTRVLKSQKSID